MKKWCLTLLCLGIGFSGFCWGFYAHKLINRQAVFLLPPEMMVLYKPHIHFLSEHAVDPDKRRYAVENEGARHYIDMDRYGPPPYNALPRQWDEAVAHHSADTLNAHGIVPWWIQIMLQRLTRAFSDKNQTRILKLSAEIGHYIADSHVPLHACSNYNGQQTNQRGIHGFWESRIPELLAEKEWDLFAGKAGYINSPRDFTWNRVLESSAAADSVLRVERELSANFSPDRKYGFEYRNGIIVRQYSTAYSLAFNRKLDNMIERRMRLAIFSVASFWYTAWVNAGQPDLKQLIHKNFEEAEIKAFDDLNRSWQTGIIKGNTCE